MANYKTLLLDEQDLWRHILPANLSVFGSAEFARITARAANVEPRLFVYSDEDCLIAYPFFVRRINCLPFAREAAEHLADILSPEYCGPVLLAGNPRSNSSAFIRAFHDYCVAEGIVAEFARLHPWRSIGKLVEGSRVVFNRSLIYVDLTQSLEEIWERSLNHQCRGSIRKAEKAGVSIVERRDPFAIRDFHSVYIDTMRRHSAVKRYWYSLSYFQAFLTELPLNSRFVLALHEGRVVACSLYLHDTEDLYAYLGGLDLEFQDLRPRNALTFEMIKWGKANGMKRLVLGGGYRPDDGVFRHKASFSPLRADFFVYQKVHIPEEYERICGLCNSSENSERGTIGFFPAYRCREESTVVDRHE